MLIACRHRSTSWSVEIWDTGAGIAENDRERIIDEFFQIDNPERQRTKGLGLGLAIVRRVAGLLGLQVHLKSRLGHGSVFSVCVPAGIAADIQESTSVQVKEGLIGRRILVVEDESAVLDSTVALLTAWGCAVTGVASGSMALALYEGEAQAPDAIVADYRLRGDETGVAAVREVRERFGYPIPSLIVSGDVSHARRSEIEALGLSFLSKPVAPGKLRSWLAAVGLVDASTHRG